MTPTISDNDIPKPKPRSKVAGCIVFIIAALVIMWIIGFIVQQTGSSSGGGNDGPSRGDNGLRKALEKNGASEDTIRKNEQFRDNVQREMDRMRREMK